MKEVGFDDFLKWVELRQRGYTYKRISQETGWSAATINKYLSAYDTEENSLSFYLTISFKNPSLMANENKESKIVRELLSLEKERRGIEKDKLLFIGMADTAGYYWCAMKSLLANKNMELGFFGAYLEDRIKYSLDLGYIDINDLIGKKEGILEIGNKITIQDIEKLLRRSKEKEEDMIIEAFLDGYFSGSLTKEDKIKALEKLSPKIRGRFSEYLLKERYPTIRWNFPWRRYVLLGIPDGITDTFVYEFKTTSIRFLQYYLKPVAFAQADLYGTFFKRKMKRVQIFTFQNNKLATWQEEVNTKKAYELLKKFEEIDEGKEPIPPKKWKCKSCEFKQKCPLYQKEEGR